MKSLILRAPGEHSAMMMRAALQRASLAALVLVACGQSNFAHADKPIYRCADGGKVTYSHAPCVGAVQINATPTQGADRSSGISRKGADVQRKEQREAFANAVRPITGMDASTFMKTNERQRLSPTDRAACAALDRQLPLDVQASRQPAPLEKARAEVALYRSRKRFDDLGC